MPTLADRRRKRVWAIHPGVLWTLILSFFIPSVRCATNEVLPLLTNVAQVLNLSRPDTERRFPIHLEGVITCYSLSGGLCFIQDNSGGIYSYLESADPNLRFRDKVAVDGQSGGGSYSPIVYHAKIKQLGVGTLPPPKRVAIPTLLAGGEDSQWVEIEGVIHKQVERGGQLMLDVVSGSDRLQSGVLEFSPGNSPQFVDAKVRIHGVAATQSNRQKGILGCYLLVPTLEQIQIMEPPLKDPFSGPLRPLDELIPYFRNNSLEHLVRVRGIVTLQDSDNTLFIQDTVGALRIVADQAKAKPGDLIEASGFATKGPYSTFLQDAVFRVISTEKPPNPILLTALTPDSENKLVQIEGEVIGHQERTNATGFMLDVQKNLIRVRYNSEEDGLRRLQNGSNVRVAGICAIERASADQPLEFTLLLRSLGDVIVLEQPKWWRLKPVIWLALLLVLVIVCGGVLNYGVRRKTKIVQLRENAREKQYLGLFQNANDIIYTHDLSGKLTSLNKAGEKILGYTEAEAMEKNLVELLAPDQQLFSAREIQPAIIGASINQREVQVMSKEGKTLFLEVTSRPLYENDKLIGVQGIARDISERKKAEAALKASEQELRELIEERERMGRDLHDGIIQSIYAVSLHLEDCRRLTKDGSSEMDRKMRAMLEDLRAIIRQVRDFIGGIESEDLKGEEFKAALKSLTLTLGETHSARFSLNIDSLAAESLQPAQATQLLHIAREAISNAVRHAQAGKTTLSLHRRGAQLRFEISDDGIGFDPDVSIASGHGLRNMAVRAGEIGATFKINSQEGGGTTIVLDILPENQHQSV